jgi:hypothetical protein
VWCVDLSTNSKLSLAGLNRTRVKRLWYVMWLRIIQYKDIANEGMVKTNYSFEARNMINRIEPLCSKKCLKKKLSEDKEQIC